MRNQNYHGSTQCVLHQSNNDCVGGEQCQSTRWNHVRETGCSAVKYQNPWACGAALLPKLPAITVAIEVTKPLQCTQPAKKHVCTCEMQGQGVFGQSKGRTSLVRARAGRLGREQAQLCFGQQSKHLSLADTNR